MAQWFDSKSGTSQAMENVQEAAQQAARAETAPRPERRYRTLLFQGYVLVTIGVFAILTILVSTTAYFSIDVTITRLLQRIESPWFAALMNLVSWFGYSFQAAVILVLAIAFLYISGLRWEAVMTFIAGAGTDLLNLLVKIVVHRARPSSSLVEVAANLGSYSFPSGHVMFYMGFYGFLLFLTFTLMKRSWRRTALIILFTVMLLLVGPSRIYLGEHWASDVLAAYLLGSLCLAASILIYRWGKTRFFVSQPVAPESPSGASS